MLEPQEARDEARIDIGSADLEAWIARSRSGDADAFGRLVTHHQAAAWRLARQRSGCAEDAEECLQEAMLSAWRSVGRFEGDADAFAAWLMRIVANRCADQWRRRRCRPVSVSLDLPAGGDVLDWTHPDPDPSPERCAERADVLRHIDGLIDQVPEPYATALRMHRDECSYGEIAEALSVPMGTVRSRLSRARDHVRSLASAGGEWRLVPIGRG